MNRVIAWAPGVSLAFLSLIVGGISLVLLMDEAFYEMLGVALAMFGALGFGVLGWFRPRGEGERESPPEEERCVVCDAKIDLTDGYAALNLHIEREERDGINVHDAGVLASCCQAACLRQLWTRLETALPELRKWNVDQPNADQWSVESCFETLGRLKS